MASPTPAPGPVDQGSAAELAEGVQTGLMELGALVAQAEVVSPEEKAELAEITQRFQGLIQRLNEGPAQAEAPAEGIAPPEAGARKVMPAM